MSYLRRLVTSLVLAMGLLVTTVAPSFANSYPGSQHFVTGQQNRHVAEVQKWLISLGYEISVTNGRYGPQTTAAISNTPTNPCTARSSRQSLGRKKRESKNKDIP